MRFFLLLCLSACTTVAPSPKPASEVAPITPPGDATSLVGSAPEVLTVPVIVLVGERHAAHVHREESDPPQERVFCDRWGSGVICDSYRY